MNLELVVDILKVGLSGLVFLLMFLAYRLLATEQKMATPRPEILSSAKGFAWTCVLLIVLVAGTAVFEQVYLPERGTALTQQLETCRESLLRLQALSAQVDPSVADLRTLIANHAAVCNPVLKP
jgi:hypothetical protein